MLVMVLTFGLTVVACEEEEEEEKKPPFFDDVTIRVYDIPSTQNGQNFTISLIDDGEVKTSKSGVVTNGTAVATLTWEGRNFAVVTKKKDGAQYWEADIGIKIGDNTQKTTKTPVEFTIRDDVTSISGSYPLSYSEFQ